MMTVEFESKMNIPEESLQNQTVVINDTYYEALDISIIPGYYSDPLALKMNWTFISQTEKELKIQLNFVNP
jgi:hypothetical protein